MKMKTKMKTRITDVAKSKERAGGGGGEAWTFKRGDPFGQRWLDHVGGRGRFAGGRRRCLVAGLDYIILISRQGRITRHRTFATRCLAKRCLVGAW